MSWFEAARFVNWLNADAGHAPAYKFDPAGAFQLWAPGDAGYNPANPFRNAQAVYVLPSIDEWYKAAFYDPALGVWWDYPTGSDDPPTPVASGTDPGSAIYNQSGPADIDAAGGASWTGTIAQAGNVSEWHETAVDLTNSTDIEPRVVRGGSWFANPNPLDFQAAFFGSSQPFVSPRNVGFRIAAVPEPTAIVNLTTAAAALLLRSRRPLGRD